MIIEKLIGGLWQWRFALLMLAIIVVILVLLLVPRNLASLTSHPRPAQSYAEAVQRIEALQAQAAPDMSLVCRLQFLTHDRQVDRIIVLVHGYTDCPQQYQALSQRFYDLGYNVLAAPLPHHGLADRMTEAHARLKAEELAIYADEMVDIAQGLGRYVVVLGISGGGVTTAWAAQNRSDIDLAVIISPAFGYQQIPTPLTVPAANLSLTLPNRFQWWDPTRLADIGPEYAYPRYSTRALAEFLRLGFAIQAAARRRPPAAHAILVVTNANDTDVNNALTATVVKDWREHQASLQTYEFEAALQLGHDLIGPTKSDQRIDIVYPKLIDLIVP